MNAHANWTDYLIQHPDPQSDQDPDEQLILMAMDFKDVFGRFPPWVFLQRLRARGWTRL